MSEIRSKQEELLALLEEGSLGFFERRRRRMIAAQNDSKSRDTAQETFS
jgi:hypothetical protein